MPKGTWSTCFHQMRFFSIINPFKNRLFSEKKFWNGWTLLHSWDGPGGLTGGKRPPIGTALTLGPFGASDQWSSSEQTGQSIMQLCFAQQFPVFPSTNWFIILYLILKCQVTLPKTCKFQSSVFAHNTFSEHWAKNEGIIWFSYYEFPILPIFDILRDLLSL